MCETAAGAKDAEARVGHVCDDARLAYRFAKRAFDIVLSLCVIAVLLAPSLLLCLAIRLESPGCPIYSQKRVGRIGKSGEVETFDMY
ncbi:MAG: sugar transferase, partial [Gordonibacter urolithinfaciens]